MHLLKAIALVPQIENTIVVLIRSAGRMPLDEHVQLARHSVAHSK
jgi:hypothetical protein